MCSAAHKAPASPPGFLSNILQRFRGSFKSDHLAGTRHLRGGRISIQQAEIIYTSTHTKTRHLSFDIAGLFVMTHVAAFGAAHTPGPITVSHLCSCSILRGPEICVCASSSHSGDNLPAHGWLKHCLRHGESFALRSETEGTGLMISC